MDVFVCLMMLFWVLLFSLGVGKCLRFEDCVVVVCTLLFVLVG